MQLRNCDKNDVKYKQKREMIIENAINMIKLMNYIKPISDSLDYNKWVERDNENYIQYAPCVLDFMKTVLDMGDCKCIREMCTRDWWNKTQMRNDISSMTEKDVSACLTAIIRKEKVAKGTILQYLNEGIIIGLLNRLKELKPFYKMTKEELDEIEISSLDIVDKALYFVVWRRREAVFSLIWRDIIYEEYERLYEEDKIQERINRYTTMTFEELEELTDERDIFQYHEDIGTSLFEKIKHNSDELGRFDIVEMTDEEFVVFYECYKKQLEKQYKQKMG